MWGGHGAPEAWPGGMQWRVWHREDVRSLGAVETGIADQSDQKLHPPCARKETIISTIKSQTQTELLQLTYILWLLLKDYNAGFCQFINRLIIAFIINPIKKTARTPLALGLKWVGGAMCWGGIWLAPGWWWWWNRGGMELGWNGICGRLQAGMCCMLQDGSCTLHPGMDHVGAVLHTGWWAPVQTGRWGPAQTGIAYGAMETGVLTGICEKKKHLMLQSMVMAWHSSVLCCSMKDGTPSYTPNNC